LTFAGEARFWRRSAANAAPGTAAAGVKEHYRAYLEGVDNLILDARQELDGVCSLGVDGLGSAGEAASDPGGAGS